MYLWGSLRLWPLVRQSCSYEKKQLINEGKYSKEWNSQTGVVEKSGYTSKMPQTAFPFLFHFWYLQPEVISLSVYFDHTLSGTKEGCSNTIQEDLSTVCLRTHIRGHTVTVSPGLLSPCSATFFVVAQLLRHVQLFAIPKTAACQVPLSSTISQSFIKFMSIDLVMLLNYPLPPHSPFQPCAIIQTYVHTYWYILLSTTGVSNSYLYKVDAGGVWRVCHNVYMPYWVISQLVIWFIKSFGSREIITSKKVFFVSLLFFGHSSLSHWLNQRVIAKIVVQKHIGEFKIESSEHWIKKAWGREKKSPFQRNQVDSDSHPYWEAEFEMNSSLTFCFSFLLIRVQTQKWQNDLSLFPIQTIQYPSNPSLCPNH